MYVIVSSDSTNKLMLFVQSYLDNNNANWTTTGGIATSTYIDTDGVIRTMFYQALISQ
jgi:hypothetical protein